jgi:hypothetical protein
MFSKNVKFAEEYKKAMLLLTALLNSKLVSSTNNDENLKEWNSLKKWLLSPEVTRKEMPLYLLRVQDFSNRVLGFSENRSKKKSYYDTLLKFYQLAFRDHERLVREMGIFEWEALETFVKNDLGVLQTLDDDILIQYLESLHELPRMDNERIRARVHKILIDDMVRWKEKFKFSNLVQVIFPVGTLLEYYNNEEMAEILQEKLSEDIVKAVEASLSFERKRLIAWEMPAASYVHPYFINPFSKWIPREERVEYFSTKIPQHNALFYGFMDEDEGIMSLIGTDNEVLTFEEVKAVMENYSAFKDKVCFQEMFEQYEKQKKRFEK